MRLFEAEDRLEWLGILGGVFILLTALGTLAGLPWTTTEFTGAAIVQTVGILLTIALGLILVGIAYTGDVRDLLPGDDSGDDE